MRNQKSSSVVAGGRRTPATERRFRCLMQIVLTTADALPCARVTASRGRDHETSSFAKLDGDRSTDQKCRIFFQTNKLLLSPSQTNIVRLKQNADKWRRTLKRSFSKLGVGKTIIGTTMSGLLKFKVEMAINALLHGKTAPCAHEKAI